MDLNKDVDGAVTVWVARVTVDGGTIVTAWSWPDKAKAWVAHELNVDRDAVTWCESEGARPGDRAAGEIEGDVVATIQQVEVMDPVSLSKQYPQDMPGARHVLD
jgi:hypothetical protein